MTFQMTLYGGNNKTTLRIFTEQVLWANGEQQARIQLLDYPLTLEEAVAVRDALSVAIGDVYVGNFDSTVEEPQKKKRRRDW